MSNWRESQRVAESVERRLRANDQWVVGWTLGGLRRKFRWAKKDTLALRLVLSRLDDE